MRQTQQKVRLTRTLASVLHLQVLVSTLAGIAEVVIVGGYSAVAFAIARLTNLVFGTSADAVRFVVVTSATVDILLHVIRYVAQSYFVNVQLFEFLLQIRSY